MTADTITAIKKSLEELREKIGHAYDSGYNRLGQLSDWCNDLDAMRPTLESLQRENEERRELARAFEAEANQLREVSIANRHRAEAAEAEVKRLRLVLEPMAKVAGDVSESWPDDADIIAEIGHFRSARAALSSTGDTHGN